MRAPTTRVLGCLCVIALSACGVGPIVDYRLHGIATAPFGSRATDKSVPFSTTFCATLTHLDPSHTNWGTCQQYLEAPAPGQPAPHDDISTDWHVLIVGGIFSHCFEEKHLFAFEQAIAHLDAVHHVSTVLLPVGSVDTPQHNGEMIADYLAHHPGKYIAVGHSKGAVDLMTAIQDHDVARADIRALVSVAGAISGSRLIDFGVKATIVGFQKAVADSGLGHCRIEDKGGIDSMRRSKRNEFLQEWKPPASLKSYSVVGVVDRDHVSPPLRTMWKLHSLYSIDQDSQMVAEEAIIPGARFLGVAKGDHWALALPFSEYPDAKVRRKMVLNTYPRVALLEAIVRYIDAEQ